MTDISAAQNDDSDRSSLGLYDQLVGFVADARWFGGKGREFEVTGVRRLGTLTGSDAAPDKEVARRC